LLKLRLRGALSFVFFCATPPALFAQTAVPAPTSTTGATTAAPVATSADGAVNGAAASPIVKGFNFAISDSSQHSSGSGWTNTLGPDISFRYNKALSGDFSIPYYTYLQTTLAGGTVLHPTVTPYTANNVIGDAAASLHLDVPANQFDYNLTVSGGFPIGNTTYGLSAQEYTYNVNNHVEGSIGPFTPEIELGIGDSSNLMQHRVLRTELIVGELAHFQAGTSVDLPFGMSFSFDAYEDMPLENLNNYKHVVVGKRKIKETILGGSGPSEDNGLENELDIPLSPHWTLSGTYTRDLRAKEDIAGFGISYILRVPKKAAPAPAPAAAH